MHKKQYRYLYSNTTRMEKLKGSQTAPRGTVWISNMELLKSGNRKQALLLAD